VIIKTKPNPKFPVSFSYLIRWVKAPINLFIYTLIYKSRKSTFVSLFKYFNFFARWMINVSFDKETNFLIANDKKDKQLKLYLDKAGHLRQYKNGISERLEKLNKDYFLEAINLNSKDFVIDIGANIGEVSLEIYRKYKCKILCIEPESREFECLKINLNKKSNVDFINKPLWKDIRSMTLYSNNDDLDSSLIFNGEKCEEITKKTTTLEEIFIEKKIKKVKLLKLEAEGAEPEILLGSEGVLKNIEYICADVGPERGVNFETTLVDTTSILLKHNFVLKKMNHPRLICLYQNMIFVDEKNGYK